MVKKEFDDILPDPKILETLADMKARGMLTTEAREVSREALAEFAPERVRPAPQDPFEDIIRQLMEKRDFTRVEAEEAVKEVK